MDSDADESNIRATEAGDEPKAPPPRNPFAEGGEQETRRPALIDSPRTAAIWGVGVALVLALLVGCICIAGSIAFG